MVVPLIVLAMGAALAGFLGVPEGLSGGEIGNYFEHFLERSIASNHASPAGNLPAHPQTESTVSGDHTIEITLTIVSSVIALLGIGIGWLWFRRKPLWEPPRLLEDKYYVDEVYDAAIIQPIKVGSTNILWKFIDTRVIDGAVNGAGLLAGLIGGVMRHLQSGLERSYVAVVVLGALLVIGYFVLK
jgi:NADH-quinone oxidoreductase subunit L